jgi:hypothetical protein
MKTSLCIGIGLTSVLLLCVGCQTTPQQAAPAPAAQGQTGPPGQNGAQGQPGEQGQTGDTGQSGNRGYTGDTGKPGDKGYTGDTGRKGDTGQPGDKGYTGNTGQKGDTGDRGKPAPCPNGQHHYTDPVNGRVRCVEN